MTLNTSIAIGGKVDPEAVYQFMNDLLGAPADVPTERKPGKITNPPGIGLPAWLWVAHNDGKPLPVHEHDKWCDVKVGPATQEEVDEHLSDVGTDPTQNGWAYVEVWVDTAYGYRGPDGESCSALHAQLVAKLGKWLDMQDIPWKWNNEYTGEWFDRDDQLAKFGGYHLNSGADDWFRNITLPAIMSDIAK